MRADAAATGDAQLEDTEPSDTELSEEEVKFAQRRLGRGGWDPVADYEAARQRRIRRQRVLLVLAAANIIAVIIGIVAGGWFWAITAVTVVLTVAYIAALRSLVRAEQELRIRRIRQLRRSRLGVHSQDDAALDIPRSRRYPGAVAIDADDDSPDFEHLPVLDSREGYGGFDGHELTVSARDDLAARRAI